MARPAGRSKVTVPAALPPAAPYVAPVARRRITHPGPVDAQRVQAARTRLTHHVLTLAPGRPLLDALNAALEPLGAVSAVLRLHDGLLAPLAYVMPALSRDAEHAVYFSERFEAAAPAVLHEATVTWGPRDGRPWLHCHARWTDAHGQPHAGHLLPEAAVLAAPLTAEAWVVDDVHFTVVPDAETRFSLFCPVPVADAPASAGRALAVRLAPNEDVCTALETLCRRHGIVQARVRGGVGSTVGAVFADGRVVEPFVTEVMVHEGRIGPGAGGMPLAELDIALVDYTGGLHQGRLARGTNPVLVTFELVLEPL